MTRLNSVTKRWSGGQKVRDIDVWMIVKDISYYENGKISDMLDIHTEDKSIYSFENGKICLCRCYTHNERNWVKIPTYLEEFVEGLVLDDKDVSVFEYMFVTDDNKMIMLTETNGLAYCHANKPDDFVKKFIEERGLELVDNKTYYEKFELPKPKTW